MTILADNVWDETVWVRRQTEAPRGCKVEIVEGLITVTPLSSVAHNGVAGRVQRRLYDVVPEDWGVYQRLPLAVPGRLGLFEPDLAVVPEALLRAGDEQLILASKAELVGEIVSAATATNDRIHKLAGYAQAGVPLPPDRQPGAERPDGHALRGTRRRDLSGPVRRGSRRSGRVAGSLPVHAAHL